GRELAVIGNAARRRQQGVELPLRRAGIAQQEGRHGAAAQEKVGGVGHTVIPRMGSPSVWQKPPPTATGQESGQGTGRRGVLQMPRFSGKRVPCSAPAPWLASLSLPGLPPRPAPSRRS